MKIELRITLSIDNKEGKQICYDGYRATALNVSDLHREKLKILDNPCSSTSTKVLDTMTFDIEYNFPNIKNDIKQELQTGIRNWLMDSVKPDSEQGFVSCFLKTFRVLYKKNKKCFEGIVVEQSENSACDLNSLLHYSESRDRFLVVRSKFLYNSEDNPELEGFFTDKYLHFRTNAWEEDFYKKHDKSDKMENFMVDVIRGMGEWSGMLPDDLSQSIVLLEQSIQKVRTSEKREAEQTTPKSLGACANPIEPDLKTAACAIPTSMQPPSVRPKVTETKTQKSESPIKKFTGSLRKLFKTKTTGAESNSNNDRANNCANTPTKVASGRADIKQSAVQVGTFCPVVPSEIGTTSYHSSSSSISSANSDDLYPEEASPNESSKRN